MDIAQHGIDDFPGRMARRPRGMQGSGCFDGKLCEQIAGLGQHRRAHGFVL
jgi:hypothetical protein